MRVERGGGSARAGDPLVVHGLIVHYIISRRFLWGLSDGLRFKYGVY